ncbi:hypothetical protein ABCL16_003502 [Vibrio parahaemolyticus]
MIKSLNAYWDYPEAKEKGKVEHRVIEVCDALFDIGAHPLSSCGGHLNYKFESVFLNKILGGNRWAHRPFIMFFSSVEQARTIDKLIHQAILYPKSDSPKFTFNWHSKGHFMEDGELVWSIEPNDYRISTDSQWIEANPQHTFDLVHRDLKLIASLIKSSVES